MTDKWIINSAKTVGRSHIRENIPCQDSVASLKEKGVTVIALSDGCSSAPLSHYGSDITVKTVCKVLTERFDDIYGGNESLVKKLIIDSIVKNIRVFIDDNGELVQKEIKKNSSKQEKFADFWREHFSSEESYEYYPLTLFYATLQFVAIKGERVIMGRLGDGIIGDIKNGSLRIVSSEDKVGVSKNETVYPVDVWCANKVQSEAALWRFEMIRCDNASQHSMFMIVSDGLDQLILTKADKSDTLLYFNHSDVMSLLEKENSESLADLIEAKFKRKTDDDLSIIYLKNENACFADKLVMRRCNEDGQTVGNEEIQTLNDKTNWIINSAKTVGRSHIRENIPCQDSVASLQKNGVSIIALSDGCGSSPLSHHGSDITVKALCNLFANNYDALYSSDDNAIRKMVVSAIVEELKGFIKTNAEMVSEFKRNNPRHYEKFKSNWPGFAQIDKIYPLTLFDATVQFVAVKDNTIIAGRLGDGIIADIHNGALRILSSEDKVGVESNATWYPSTVLIASENPDINPWNKFEIFKGNKATEYGMFLIVSDGVADVICGEDEGAREKFLYPDEIDNLLKHSGKLFDILEEQYKPAKGIYDDLSVIVMQRPVVKIDKMILRQYDEKGRTIANSKVHVVGQLDTVEIPVVEERQTNNVELDAAENECSLNLLDEETNKKIEKYIKDIGYRAFFIEQASKVLQHLEKSGTEKLDKMFSLLQPYVDEDDWKLMIKQFSKLKLFVIDKKKGTLSRKES